MSSKSGSSALAELLKEERLMPLGPGQLTAAARVQLEALTRESVFGSHPIHDDLAAEACFSGLWLYFDGLDQSHSISQDLDTKEGSFWHAIMHRREPDAWNSKYWWRKVGAHPVIDQLVRQAPSLGYQYQNPPDFVDFCERVRDSGSAEEELAKRVQLLEWQLLFDHCHRRAIS